MEKAFVVKRVADQLWSTEAALDDALLQANDLMREITQARREFGAAVPLFIGTWMLAGLFIGLSPYILHGIFDLDSGLLNGAIVAVPPAVGAMTGLLLTRAPARTTTVWAMAAIIVGVGIAAAGIAGAVLPLLFAGAVVAGAGF